MLDVLIKFIADYLVIIIAVTGAFIVLTRVKKDRYQVYLRLMMMGLTALVIAKVASLLLQPSAARPFELMNTSPLASYLNNPGFPSDHVLFVMAIAVAVWVATKSRIWGLIFLGLALLVAVGRVVALVHTVTDVVGSIIIVAIAAAIWYWPSRRMRKTAKA